jgi:hypothetical protein
MQATSEEILNDIQNLQETEQGLFNSLETNSNLTTEQRDQIMQNISQITNMRVNLYQALSNVNGFFQNTLRTSHGTLEDQSVAIRIVEQELNRMKQGLQTLQTEKTNKLRLVEINTYYGDKYAEHSQLMKIVIFTLVPIIILTLLKRNDLIPSVIYYSLTVVIAAIGAYFFWKRMASVLSRDSIYYDEYNWQFNPGDLPKPSGDKKDPWLSNGNLGTCIGPMCCSTGQTYDASLNQCVGDSTVMVPAAMNSSLKESFVNHVLSKDSSTNNYKSGNIFSNPTPSNTKSFAFNKWF